MSETGELVKTSIERIKVLPGQVNSFEIEEGNAEVRKVFKDVPTRTEINTILNGITAAGGDMMEANNAVH